VHNCTFLGYIPIRTPARKLTATPTPIAGTPQGFFIQTEDKSAKYVDNQPKGNLPFMKPEDAQYFDKLLVDVDEETLSPEEQKERKIMKLLLKIKNGTPPMRKAALRQITDKAREFGAGPLFNQILPLLMSPTLEDQERHLLVKVIDRILYKLDDLVRPYVHKVIIFVFASTIICYFMSYLFYFVFILITVCLDFSCYRASADRRRLLCSCRRQRDYF